MGTVRWTGNAVAVAQVDTITVGGTVEVGDKFITTINGKAISVTCTTTNTTTTAAEIATALAASTIAEFKEATWVAAAATIVATAVVAGRPFTVTATTTENNDGAADDQTYVRAATVVNAGPNVWSTATNWNTGVVPAAADDIYIENSRIDILYDLDQSGIGTFLTLNIAANYTGKIGLPAYNSGGYAEYRADYLIAKVTTQRYGYGPGAGSPRLKINNSTIQTTLTVSGSAASADAGLEAIQWKGTHASNVVTISKGSFGVAVVPGETATIATLNVGWISNQSGDSQVRCTSGVTLTTINQDGGSLEINSNSVTLTKTAGTLTIGGSATVTTLHERGGTTYYNSSGTITTLNVSAGGTVTTQQRNVAKTITNTNLYSGSALLDPSKTITFTNAAAIAGGAGLKPIDADGVLIDLGTNFSIQRS